MERGNLFKLFACMDIKSRRRISNENRKTVSSKAAQAAEYRERAHHYPVPAREGDSQGEPSPGKALRHIGKAHRHEIQDEGAFPAQEKVLQAL